LGNYEKIAIKLAIQILGSIQVKTTINLPLDMLRQMVMNSLFTCVPDKVKTFRTAPVSSFTASVMLENA
jgi:hypothetical protein